MKLLSRLTPASQPESRMSWDEYISLVQMYQQTPQTTYGTDREAIAVDFASNAAQIYKRNGPIFALMGFRLALFAQVRWMYQSFSSGRPGDLFGLPSLDVLNSDPYLSARMIQDVDLAGNFYGVREGDRIVRLRPDWVELILSKESEYHDAVPIGVVYYAGGKYQADTDDITIFDYDQVVHWWPTPDPEASYRGMSWLSPIAREVGADNAATAHKLKFFENGATPNLVFKFAEGTAPSQVKEFKELITNENTGTSNAYKNLYLGGGADVTVVGADLRQLEFGITQGKGESRLAAAARVPAVLVGFSEGMQAATYSNFSQARRGAADSLLHPLWVSAAGALGRVVQPPAGARLWYDARDIPFLREDAKDDAEIKAQEAQTIRTLVDAGYTPESVVAAVQSGDWSRLQHTNLFSVQLQPPGVQPDVAPTPAPRSIELDETMEGRTILRVVHE